MWTVALRGADGGAGAAQRGLFVRLLKFIQDARLDLQSRTRFFFLKWGKVALVKFQMFIVVEIKTG